MSEQASGWVSEVRWAPATVPCPSTHPLPPALCASACSEEAASLYRKLRDEVRAVGGRWGWGRDAAGTQLSAVRVLRSHPAFPLPCDAEQVPWEAREIQLFGKPVMQPRLIAYMADGPEMQYSYSGATVTPTPR